MGIDGLSGLFLVLLFPAVGLLVLYAIIRWAVRDGMNDALLEQDARRAREQRRLQERDPNQSP